MANAQRWRSYPPRQVEYEYPDTWKTVRDELAPVQAKIDELTKQVNQLALGAVTRTDLTEIRTEISTQMQRIETRYYPREVVDALFGQQTTTIHGLRDEIRDVGQQVKDLAQRPTRALNGWAAIASIIGGIAGGLALLSNHLGLVIH